jgi:glycosyltransferase involved in cell wall biosynthesis
MKSINQLIKFINQLMKMIALGEPAGPALYHPSNVHELQSVPSAQAPSVIVAIPAYNEDRFIGSLVLKLRSHERMVVVVDDGSTDATADVAEAAGAMVIRHPRNRGKTAAVKTIFEQARRLSPDALVLLDGDSQHDPAEVDAVVKPILQGTADMVVGSRFAGVRSVIPRWRVAGQHALTVATNIGSGLRLSDTESGYRAFSRRALEQMRFRGRGFALEAATQFQAKEHGWRVVEVPIRVHYKIPLKRNPVWHGVGQIDAILRLIAEHRPLLFFGVPGLFVLLAGLGLGFQVVRIYDATQQLAIGYSMITVLLVIVGVLSLFVGVMLHAIREIIGDALREGRPDAS